MQYKVLYILGATLKIHDRLETLFGPSLLREAGQSISISIPWVCDSLHSEVAFTLSRLQTPFFKTWCKQNPPESVVGWPRVHCAALHTNWSSSRERYWQGTVANRPGSKTQTQLFPSYAIRYTQ